MVLYTVHAPSSHQAWHQYWQLKARTRIHLDIVFDQLLDPKHEHDPKTIKQETEKDQLPGKYTKEQYMDLVAL